MVFSRCNRHSTSSPDTGWGKVNRITVAWKKCRVNHRQSTSHHCYAVVKRKMPHKWGGNRKTACKIGKPIILLYYPMIQLKFQCFALVFSPKFFTGIILGLGNCVSRMTLGVCRRVQGSSTLITSPENIKYQDINGIVWNNKAKKMQGL